VACAWFSMAAKRIDAETVSVTSVNFSGHAPDRQSSYVRIMNRIRVGAVNDYRPDLRRAEGEIDRMPGQALGLEEPGDVDSSIESRTSTIDRGLSLSTNPDPNPISTFDQNYFAAFVIRVAASSCPAGPSHSAS
jgi:hypothetical protein